VRTGTTLKRVAGLLVPLAIGGSALAVRAAAAGDSHAAPSAASCTTTTAGSATTAATTATTAASTTTTSANTSGSTTTTSGLPITLPGGGSTTTTTACATTTTASAICPTATTSAVTTTTAATTTTTSANTSGSTTTTSGLPVTLPGGGGSTTTTAPATTTTECATTTTTQSVVITSVATNHIAGAPVILNGTASAGSPIVVTGHDPKVGTHNLGGTTTGTNGKWQLRIAHGVLYNTVVQAFSGTKSSNKVTVAVHQVLTVKSHKLVAKKSNGFHYVVRGSTTSHIPGEVITVLIKGHVVGKARLSSNGTFTVKFVSKKKSPSATVHGSGKSGSGKTYTLAGSRSFRA
jgi:hypothetical protein